MDEDPAADLMEQAAVHARAGGYAEAARLGEQAVDLLHPDDGIEHEVMAFVATCWTAAGEATRAMDAWSRAAATTADPEQRVAWLAEAAEAARVVGRWPEALDLLSSALDLAEATFGPASEATARVAHDLAKVGKYSGRFDEAERLYQRALAVAVANGDRSTEAVICHNLGGLAHAARHLDAAESWTRRALRIQEKLGNEHGLAADSGALGAILLARGAHDEARAMLDQAEDAFSRLLGRDHYEVGVVAGNLAALALAQGDLVGAEEAAKRALAIKERALGADHPELAPTLTTLGTVVRRQGRPQEAGALHERALAALEPVVEPDHPLLATVRENLAKARAATGHPPSEPQAHGG